MIPDLLASAMDLVRFVWVHIQEIIVLAIIGGAYVLGRRHGFRRGARMKQGSSR